MAEKEMTGRNDPDTLGGKWMACGFKGPCMEPLLKDGDILIVQKIKPEKIKLGELVCFKRDGRYICHRLMFREKKNGELLLYEKSDIAIHHCARVRSGSVIGKAIKALRGKEEIPLEQGLSVRFGFVLRFIFSRLLYEMKKFTHTGTHSTAAR